MGGKTQQRVAGNVKPSSSGRIRELLINQQQQQGTGGIITFSALSNKFKQQQQQKQPTEAEKAKPLENEEKQKTADSPPKKDKHVDTTKEGRTTNELAALPPASPAKDNYRLVVKRVGNRDLYVRVKSSDHIELDESIKPAVTPAEAGVKKPVELSSEKLQSSPEIDETELDKLTKCETSSPIDREEPRDPEDDFDFPKLIDLLAETQDLLGDTLIKSMDELNEEQAKQVDYMLKLYRLLLANFSAELSIVDWNSVVIFLETWIGLISKAKHPLQNSYQVQLCVNVFDFIYQLKEFAQSIQERRNNLKDDWPMMQSLLDDWNNFHTSQLFQDLLSLFLKLIKMHQSRKPDDPELELIPIIESLAQVVIGIDPSVVLSDDSSWLNCITSTRIEFDREFPLPSNAIFCDVGQEQSKGFLTTCSLMQESDLRVVLISAHRMLLKMMDKICEAAETSTLISDEEDIDGIPIFPPTGLMSILTSKDSMMTALLSDYRAGDISVTIEPNTDSYTCTLAYLFVWDLIIQFIVSIDKQVGHRIIASLKRTGAIQRLLDNIFMLLPPLGEKDSLNLRIESSSSNSSSGHAQPWNVANFLKNPLELPIKRSINEIELVALHLYFSVALHMPVTVRKWYNNNSNKRLCNLVNEYTVKHISQVICSLEMESVQQKCQERASKEESRNLVIKARPSAKEVYAVYTRDEFKMELTIKLPVNYPLSPIHIDGGKRVGVTDNKWRGWLLKLTTFLSHQNGPILDGVDLWKKNLDKRFEGVEKCTICFSILHSNYQLPKKKCQTCANMFHNLCLYKWFESSGNSTCPLCRNAW